jgi:hypothetical protein
MPRKFVDTSIIEMRNMKKDGNIDRSFWHSSTIQERLKATATMISVAFQEPNFLKKKVDRTYIEMKKRAL